MDFGSASGAGAAARQWPERVEFVGRTTLEVVRTF